MKDFFLNPAVSIIISQIVVIWSLVLRHYSEKKFTKYMTIFAAIPLTVYALIIGVNEFKSKKDASQYLNSLIERIDKKVIDAEDKLTVLNTDIGNVSMSIRKLDDVVKDINEVADATNVLKATLNTLNNNFNNINVGLKGLSETQVKLSSNLSKEIGSQVSLFTQQTNTSLNDVMSSTKKTVEAMNQLDHKYMQITKSLEYQRAEIAANFQQEMAQRNREFLMNYNQQMMQQNQNMLQNMMRSPRIK